MMGPMGSMMGGSSGATGGPDLLSLVVLLALVLGVAGYAMLAARGGLERRRTASPEESLRERYGRGDIGREQYFDALEDILKARYVRGEITVDEYEARVQRLLGSPLVGSTRSAEQRQ